MKNISHLISIVEQSRHMPALLSLVLGLTVIRKKSSIFFSDGEITGDNIPITLMESIRG